MLRPDCSSGAQHGVDPFHATPGNTVHRFTAIHVPMALQTEVAHRWRRYGPSRDPWVNTDRIGDQGVGGRRLFGRLALRPPPLPLASAPGTEIASHSPK